MRERGWNQALASGLMAVALHASAQPPSEGAQPSLALPCTDAGGRPVAETVIKALREEGGGEPLRVAARDGICRIALPAGAHWVKAEAPGMRSVAIRVVDGAAPGRELRLQPTAGRDADWQRRLQEIVQRDQAVRHALDAARRQGDAQRIEQAERDLQEADRAQQAQLEQWLQARGFPRAADVGFDGVAAFWLLLQHAPDLMAPCLPQLRAAVAAGELQRSSLALSEDRIAMIQGRPQRYGSQLQQDAGGKLVLYPLADPRQVDAWRAEMDLEPLATYLKRFEP